MIISIRSDDLRISSPLGGEGKQGNSDSNKVDRDLSTILTTGKFFTPADNYLTMT